MLTVSIWPSGAPELPLSALMPILPLGVESAVWDETYRLPVFNGVYSVDLGSRPGQKKALPSSVFPTGADR